MSFGIYVHIPYCLQRCTYCDFATYEQSQILPPHQYFDLLFEEIKQKANTFSKTAAIETIYFGGGTPSLVPAELIVAFLNELTTNGFLRNSTTELTLEINPATIDQKKLELYLKAGFNRFSVGAQTFDDALLKSVRREHNSKQTRETVKLLRANNVNYSLDLLFALPGQTLDQLKFDLDEILNLNPQHISPYCLTVPEGHILSTGRPLEDIQLQMFELIRSRLEAEGYERYEISNFAKPGFESKHNSIYWDDESYWGIGLSAHSYDNSRNWGVRYWNANNITEYEKQIQSSRGKQFITPEQSLPNSQKEFLKPHQALTDFCHISLRRRQGLDKLALEKKFGAKAISKLQGPLAHLVEQELLLYEPNQRWRLSEKGVLLSNQVFGALTFLENEWP